MKKALFLSIFASVVALFSSCETCFNERFCREMMGKSRSQIVAIMGTPTETNHTAGTDVYRWIYDNTYYTTETIPAERRRYVDNRGVEHTEYYPPEVRTQQHLSHAEMSFSFINNKAVSYNTYDAGSAGCNVLVPSQYLRRYQAEEQAAKAAAKAAKQGR